MSTPSPHKDLQIPQQTKEYISLVTDPYHDRNLRVSGFPDGRNVTSVVRRLAYQTSVACPFAITTGESWDFHIFTTPLHNAVDMYSATRDGVSKNRILITPTTTTINTVNIFYRHYDNAGAIKAIQFKSLGQPPGLSVINPDTDGPGRTVSLAFELHNTTAELYKSGSLTTYRVNALDERCDLIDMYVPATPRNYTCTNILNLPDTLEQANLIPNARTWEAAAGVYSVSLPPSDNHYTTGIFTNVIMNINRTTSPFLVFGSSLNSNGSNINWSPLNCTGVMSSRFTNVEQTFTLDMRQVLEYKPSAVSSSLLPFATTSPDIDTLFLKMYKKMLNRIEPGVPVGFNSAGEWFRRILILAKEQLPSLIHLLPPQYQAAAQAVLPLADKVANTVINKLSKQPNKAKKTPKQRKSKTRNPQLLQLRAQAQRFMKSNKQ